MTLTFEPPAGFDYSAEAPSHEKYQGIVPQAGLQEARVVIEHAILHQPRSLQRTIGPSELGTPCDHCLAAKIAGWESKEKDVPWLPFIGTSVHTAIEDMFIRYETRRNAVNTTGLRYLTERRTMVGHVDGQPIHGSVDLVDLAAGMTIDWKVVGTTTLRNAKTGPSQVYRAQAHLYAKGLTDEGFDIRHVAIAYLPRNAISLAQAVWWTEPHDRTIAEDALIRANRFALNIRALRTISEETLTGWITQLPRHEGCRDCERFADFPVKTTTLDDIR